MRVLRVVERPKGPGLAGERRAGRVRGGRVGHDDQRRGHGRFGENVDERVAAGAVDVVEVVDGKHDHRARGAVARLLEGPPQGFGQGAATLLRTERRRRSPSEQEL